MDNGETIAIKVGESYFDISTDGEVKGEIEVKIDSTPGTIEGNGTVDEPFVIMSIEDLVLFSKQVNEGINNYWGKNVELGKTLDFNSDLSYVNTNTTEYDIYLGGDGTKGLKEQLTNGLGFRPIGKDTSEYFSGSFDGKNNSIKNIKIDAEGYGGLFGYIEYATIKNITVTGNIKSIDYAGGIAGYANLGEGSAIVNCENFVDVSSITDAGGIVGFGYIDNGEISNCSNYGSIKSSSSYAAGIVGYFCSDDLQQKISSFKDNCNYGYVCGKDAGGIVGYQVTSNNAILNCMNAESAVVEANASDGNAGGIIAVRRGSRGVYNCINLGTVSAHKAGGICGNPLSWGITIKNSYSTGNIFGTYAGVIVGSHDWSDIAAEAINCYYLTTGNTSNTSGGEGQSVDATGVEKLTQTHIDALNEYIENDPEKIGTTEWNKWMLNENGNPNFAK